MRLETRDHALSGIKIGGQDRLAASDEDDVLGLSQIIGCDAKDGIVGVLDREDHPPGLLFFLHELRVVQSDPAARVGPALGGDAGAMARKNV